MIVTRHNQVNLLAFSLTDLEVKSVDHGKTFDMLVIELFH